MKFPRYRRSHDSMKRLYNWFHNYYGRIEQSLGPILENVINEIKVDFPDAKRKTVLEYACGSGLLSFMLAGMFESVRGRDLSEGMIGRAKVRARESGIGNVEFSIGNILEPDERPGSFDYAFVSFAMHLFPPETEIRILDKLFLIAREAVVIIDHGRKWDVPTAIIEWLEGGYYDVFIKQDFNRFAGMIGAKTSSEKQIEGCTVLIFRK